MCRPTPTRPETPSKGSEAFRDPIDRHLGLAVARNAHDGVFELGGRAVERQHPLQACPHGKHEG